MNPDRHNSSPTEAAEVLIQLRTRTAVVSGAFEELLAPLLSSEQRRFSPGGRLGHQQRREHVAHYAIDEEGRVVFSAGLVARVQRHLEQQGYAIHVENGARWGHLEAADVDLVDNPDLTGAESRCLRALAAAPRGQILVRKAHDVAHSISLLAGLFSGHDIFVVARNRNCVRKLVEQIAASVDRPVTDDSRLTWSHRPRLFVGTEKLFEHVSSEAFQIVVFTDIQSALAKATVNLFKLWPHAAWYAVGLTGEHARLAEGEKLQLEEVFGPVIFEPERRKRVPDVNAVFVDCTELAAGSQQEHGLVRKRGRYWENEPWNSSVASVARGVASGGVPGGVPRELIAGKKPRTAVLVESSEHGQTLRKLLRGWKLLTVHSMTNCAPQVAHRQIATMTYAAEYGISADVLIRADGGPDWPLGDALAARTLCSSESVLVIDFADERDQQAKIDTASRRAAYERRGWRIVSSLGASIPHSESLQSQTLPSHFH